MSLFKKVFVATLIASSFSYALTSQEHNDINIFKNNRDSVVFISTNKKIIDYTTLTRYIVPRGSGSGFIWNKDGYIVTNYHVVRGASSATVKLSDGKSYQAFPVGSYPRRDITVLKIKAPQNELKPIKLGNSDKLQVGQSVYAIGNPYGLDWTMTKGIVSALNRKVTFSDGGVMSGAIQTDAAINPGNSGGVMLDSSGRAIGVNSAIYSPNGGSVGIGFAIPINLVKKVVKKIIKYGHYIKPSLGIESDDITNNYLNNTLNIKGVAVLGVIRGSDAYKNGLIPARFYSDGSVDFGDIIVVVDGKKVSTVTDLDDILEKHKIGDIVNVTILRGRVRKSIPIKLTGLNG